MDPQAFDESKAGRTDETDATGEPRDEGDMSKAPRRKKKQRTKERPCCRTGFASFG